MRPPEADEMAAIAVAYRALLLERAPIPPPPASRWRTAARAFGPPASSPERRRHGGRRP